MTLPRCYLEKEYKCLKEAFGEQISDATIVILTKGEKTR
jgi:hypothetical protein